VLLLVLVASRRRSRGIVAFLVGCSTGVSPTDAGVDAPVLVEPSVEPRFVREYAVAGIFPTGPAEVGVDLDGDGDVDNALGAVSRVLSESGLNVNRVLFDAVRSGRWPMLAQLSMDGEGRAALRIFRGTEGDSPDPSGNGLYRVDGPARAAFFGTYEPSLEVDLSASRAAMWAPTPGGEVGLPLVEARVRGPLTPLDATVQLGGLLTEGDLNRALGVVLEAFESDPRIAELDADEDGEVTPLELRDHAVLGPLLRPDVDLDGDGVPDHFSVGVRLDLVRGHIDDVTASERSRRHKSGDAGVPMSMCTPDPCADAVDCAACNARPECGWCTGEFGCVERSRQSECESNGDTWADRLTECVDCTSRSTCEDCVRRNAFCGWCPSMGCVHDTGAVSLACAGYRRVGDACE
jgi:hypothetical protein